MLTGCSDNKDGADGPTPTPSATCDFTAQTIPASCVPEGPDPSVTAFPDDPTAIPPVTMQPVDGKLGGADNRVDASKRTATFTVTVPKGARIGSVVDCLGNGTVELKTVPTSRAFQKIACNSDPEMASELVAEDPDVLKADTTFTVTVTADAASRWDVAVFQTTQPVLK